MCVCVCVFCSNTFLRGVAPPVIPPAYGTHTSKAVGGVLQGFTPVGDRVPCVTGQSRDLGASFSPKIRLPIWREKWAYIGNREMSDKLRNE